MAVATAAGRVGAAAVAVVAAARTAVGAAPAGTAMVAAEAAVAAAGAVSGVLLMVHVVYESLHFKLKMKICSCDDLKTDPSHLSVTNTTLGLSHLFKL